MAALSEPDATAITARPAGTRCVTSALTFAEILARSYGRAPRAG